MVKTCTVRELINVLNTKSYLDKKVLLSSDEEGNSFGTVNLERSLSLEGDYIVFFPFEERLDIDF
jgi:hypothetical protein